MLPLFPHLVYVHQCCCQCCRGARKEEKRRDEHRKQLGLPDAVQLLPASGADEQAAALISFGDASAFANSRCVSSPVGQCCRSLSRENHTLSEGARPGKMSNLGVILKQDRGVHARRQHRRQAIKDQPIFSRQAAAGGAQQQASGAGSVTKLAVRGGVKGKSTLDKAALLLKRRRMDASLKLGLSSPGSRS